MECLLGPPVWKECVKDWLKEDIPTFDWAALAIQTDNNHGSATLWAKSEGVLAGAPFFEAVFEYMNCSVQWHLSEGTFLSNASSSSKIRVATVTGSTSAIFHGERVALNILSHLSGIATGAASAIAIVKGQSLFKGRIAGTRKCLPGLRIAQKYALAVGGADVHRMDLSSLCMIKDNHIDASKLSLKKLVESVKKKVSFTVKVEVECRSKEDAMQAALGGADIVMLDHLKGAELTDCIKGVKEVNSNVCVEVSGGINLSNLKSVLEDCDMVDVISMGCLTQSVKSVDFSLKINK